MRDRIDGETIRWLDALNREGSFHGTSDALLLDRFLEEQGRGSEAAFEVIVRRHGPMVMRLCHGVLRDDHAADDAFQATFCVLARRASDIRNCDRLAPWLGRVARRIALRSRKAAARRAALEQHVAAKEERVVHASEEGLEAESASLIRQEVDRLPERDRLLVQLTYWQGKSYQEAASLLRWPVGTVRSRLSRIRERLGRSLSRLGVAPGLLVVIGLALPGTNTMAAQPSEALILKTVRLAQHYGFEISKAAEAGIVSASVAGLVEGEFAAMVISWKWVAALMLAGATATAGITRLAVNAPVSDVPQAAQAAAPIRLASQKKEESKSLLTNGGVEEGTGDTPSHWNLGSAVPGVEYRWSRDIAHTGKGSLRLKKTAQRYFPIAQWFQEVAHQGKGRRLKVFAWVKADVIGKAILDAQFIDKKGDWSHAWVAYIGAKEAGQDPVSHDWKRYEGVVDIPPDTKQILIAPQIYGPGTVWFDDLGAEYTDAPVTDPTAGLKGRVFDIVKVIR